MPKCVKCGYENKWRSKECVNCGTRLFMGMTVIESYKLNLFQKIIVFIVKYIFVLVDIHFLWECFSVLFNMKGNITRSIFNFVILLINNAPWILLVTFAVIVLDWGLKNSDHPDSIDFKKTKNNDNFILDINKNKDNDHDENI